MSLAELLAEHSRDINANISHSNEMASDNAERKANTLEEKFQHAKDSIESAGGEVAAAAGAYHLGRKIYQKYQAKKAQRVQSNEDGKSNNSEDAQKEAPEPEPEAGGAEGDVSELTETGAKDLAGATKSVASEASDNILSKVAGAGGDALTAGLDTASAVLDALGPVGEVAGVITSLVGLFEGLHHHKKEVEETGESDVAQTTAEAGLDPKALLGAQ